MTVENFSLQAYDLMVFAGFEILTPVVMNSSIFWDITPFCPLKIN
jgi:hypothetical protein